MKNFYLPIVLALAFSVLTTGCKQNASIKPTASKSVAQASKPKAKTENTNDPKNKSALDKKSAKTNKDKQISKATLKAAPKNTKTRPKKAISAKATTKQAKPKLTSKTLNPTNKKTYKKEASKKTTKRTSPAKTAKSAKPQPAKRSLRPMPIKPKLASSDNPQQMIERLQQKKLQLIIDLERAEEKNLRLTDALIEARQTANNLQADQNRKSIMLEIQKLKMEELQDKISDLTGKTPKTASTAKSPKEALPTALELARYKRQCKILQLQLKLASLNEPAKTRKLLEKIMELSQQADDLTTINRNLSKSIVRLSRQNTLAQHKIAKLEKKVTNRKSPVTAKTNSSSPKHTSEYRAGVEAIVEKESSTPPPKITYASRKVEARPSIAKAKPKPRSSKPITGKITAIKDGVVLLNIGQSNGLESGMRLIVYRQDKFVGYLRVDDVSKTEAAGTLTRKVYPPKLGDNVIDRLD